MKSSGADKVSQIFGNSILARKRSNKGKSVLALGVKSLEKSLDSSQVDVSCSTKPENTSAGVPVEGSSSCPNDDDEKQLNASPTDSLADTKFHPAEEVLPHSQVTKSEQNDEVPVEKHEKSSTNGSSGIKFVLAIGASERDRKRKPEVKDEDSQKKLRVDKRKRSASASKKRRSKIGTLSPGTSKLHEKQRTNNDEVSASLCEVDVGTKGLDAQRKDEVSI